MEDGHDTFLPKSEEEEITVTDQPKFKSDIFGSCVEEVKIRECCR